MMKIFISSAFILSLFFGVLTNCKSQKVSNKLTKKLHIKDLKEQGNCFIFKGENDKNLEFQRIIKVISNSLNDTVVIGGSVLPPNYLGEIKYLMLKDNKNEAVDLDYPNPLADRLWIFPFKNRKNIDGILTLELQL